MEPKMILDRILITEEEIRERVAAIAAQIDAKYHERGGLVLLCALKGAYVFTADLSRKIQTPHSVEFIQAASYGNNTQSSGNVQLRETMSEDLAGKNILLVEDIYDR
ncbi:MAG: phosphoribosyltransferase [Candidatus Sumerlaeota bacterium]